MPLRPVACSLSGWSRNRVCTLRACRGAALTASPDAIEQVAWISDHLQQMCELAPPGFLHITIFVTSKRTSDEVAILPGYVTEDKRSLVESEGEKAARPSGIESPAVERVKHGSRVELRSGRPDFRELVEREVQHSAYTE